MPPTISNNPKIVAMIFPVFLLLLFGIEVVVPEFVGDGGVVGVLDCGAGAKLVSVITTDSSGTDALSFIY